jgi:ketosteroid isomerase-like protein
MASENVELVRSGIDAFNEQGVEGILPLIHPEFEATTPPELASEPDTYRGHEGVRRYFESFYDVMDEIRWEAHSIEEVNGKVIVDFTLHARGKTTGIDTELRAVQVWTVREGKAIRLELYPTREEALAAANEGAL